MTLGRLLFIFGIILFIYAIISGFNFSWEFIGSSSDYQSSYTFKIGTLIFSLLMIYVGWRIKEK